MDSSDLLSAVEYEFQLNPSQDYKLAGIQTEPYAAGLNVVGGGGPDLEVIDAKLYACTCRTNSASSGVDTYHFRETELLSANVRAGAGNINEEFSVPSTTDSLTLFIQDKNAGKNWNVPSSRFHNKYLQIDGNPTTTPDALTLNDYQIEYAGLTKPATRINSEHKSASLVDVGRAELGQR